MLSRLYRLISLKAFFGDRRGVSAVEFALVAPVLIMAYLGLAELALGMMASRKASHLAATIGDLAAQSETLNDSNISDLYAIGTSMLSPYDTSGSRLKMRLSSVTMQSNSKATVDWSSGRNLTAYANGAQIASITTAQISAGQSLMMTEVEYDYTSPIGDFLPGQSAFKFTFYHHPRNGAMVTKS